MKHLNVSPRNSRIANMGGRSSNQGSILIVALAVIALVSILAGSAFQLTTQNARNTSRTESMLQTQAMAEGAMEMMFAQWRNYIDQNADLTSGNLPTRGALKFIEENLPTTNAAIASAFNIGGVQYTISQYRVVPIGVGGALLTSPDSSAPAEIQLAEVAEGTIFGTERPPDRLYRYAAQVTITRPAPGPTREPISVSLSRIFEVKWTSLTDNAIFYEDLMEIFPGADMGIFGKVHSNGDLYYGHSQLTFWDNVAAAGNLYNTYAPTDGTRSGAAGNINWGNKTTNTTQSTPHTGQASSQTSRKEVLGSNPEQLFTDPANPNHSSLGREIIERPVANSPDPIASLRMYNQADVRILMDTTQAVNSPNRLRVFKKVHGNNPASETEVLAGDPLYTAVASSVVRTNSISATTNLEAQQGNNNPNYGQIVRDNREGGDIHLTSIDVNKLGVALGSNVSGADNTGFNGVVYISDQSAATRFAAGGANADESSAIVYNPNTQAYESRSGLEKGIRLVNGGVLPNQLATEANASGGLTIASDNPVYIMGDYNTGRTVNAANQVVDDPTSNNGQHNTTNNGAVPRATDVLANNGQGNDRYNDFITGGEYERKPAMVAGDAVNFISNNWNDANSTLALASRVPSHTTFNTAIVSGNVPSGTVGGNYSGGVENFPRFMENWSNSRHVTYYGSIIQLYQSRYANGRWGQGNVYAAPRRRWYYENKYRRTPPPGIVATVDFGRGRWINSTGAY